MHMCRQGRTGRTLSIGAKEKSARPANRNPATELSCAQGDEWFEGKSVRFIGKPCYHAGRFLIRGGCDA